MNITDQLAQALEPFAACAEHLTRFRSISDEETWLWKPSDSKREIPGISAAHILAASKAIEAYRASKEGEKWQDETAQRLADNYKAAVESGDLPEVP